MLEVGLKKIGVMSDEGKCRRSAPFSSSFACPGRSRSRTSSDAPCDEGKACILGFQCFCSPCVEADMAVISVGMMDQEVGRNHFTTLSGFRVEGLGSSKVGHNPFRHSFRV
jgi:hypothetical protein